MAMCFNTWHARNKLSTFQGLNKLSIVFGDENKRKKKKMILNILFYFVFCHRRRCCCGHCVVIELCSGHVYRVLVSVCVCVCKMIWNNWPTGPNCVHAYISTSQCLLLLRRRQHRWNFVIFSSSFGFARCFVALEWLACRPCWLSVVTMCIIVALFYALSMVYMSM